MKRQKIERKQPTPQELTDGLLDFIRLKFYPEDNVEFAKDRPRLLKWVVLDFATWLDEKALTLSTGRYNQILRTVLMEAVIHGTEKIKYRPAWLRMVVQSHLRIHGEDYYNEAKSIRNLTENALALAGGLKVRQPDPIRDLATAARLVSAKKKPVQTPVKNQLNLL